MAGTRCATKRLMRTIEKSSLKIKLNIPTMFPQSYEWGESQLMQENMVSAPYASALTHIEYHEELHLWNLLQVITTHDQQTCRTFYQLCHLFMINVSHR